MKALGISKANIGMGIAIVNLLLAIVARFALLPHFTISSTASWYVSLIIFAVGSLAGFALLFMLEAFGNPARTLLGVADAVRQPLLLVDERNRYQTFNHEAERVLKLDRKRNLGDPLDGRIAAIIASGVAVNSETLSVKTIVEMGGTHYQVINYPLPSESGAMGTRHLVILREIGHILQLREAVREINHTMDVLNANTLKIADSAVSLSQGATEQATTLSSITSSMDEFSKKIQGNTESAAKGTQLAAQAREAAERSGGEITHALSAMTDVQDAGIRIARIVRLIDDIAFQTNLLALNAAVEAARAGRQGKGFAVVADEVRNLAGRSAKAAKDTASMVEDVTERIGNASAYISKLEDMLNNIVQDAIRIADSSAVASATSTEQATGILKVNQELLQMNSVTHTTMSAAEQTATAVEILSRQVNALKQKLDSLSSSFALDEQIDQDNGRWNNSRLAINLTDSLTPDDDRYAPSYFDSRNTEPDGGYSTNRFVAADDEDSASFIEPFKNLSQGEMDWDTDSGSMNTDSSRYSPLSENPDYMNYSTDPFSTLSSPRRSSDTRFTGFPSEEVDKFSPDAETPEGDRVIKPSQNIHLDDAEFGRY